MMMMMKRRDIECDYYYTVYVLQVLSVFKEGDLLTLSGFLEGNQHCVAHQDKKMLLYSRQYLPVT